MRLFIGLVVYFAIIAIIVVIIFKNSEIPQQEEDFNISSEELAFLETIKRNVVKISPNINMTGVFLGYVGKSKNNNIVIDFSFSNRTGNKIRINGETCLKQFSENFYEQLYAFCESWVEIQERKEYECRIKKEENFFETFVD